MFFLKMIELISKEVQLEKYATTYKVIAFSTNDGMLELVPDSEDINKIDNGKSSSCLISFFKKFPSKLAELKENFLNSLAFYSVLTYIFGIGD